MHTTPLSRSHIPAIPLIASTVFSSAPHYLFLRPRHPTHPDRAYAHYLQKLLLRVTSPNTVIRVCVSDDSDPWWDDSVGEQLLGYAMWSRDGHDDASVGNEDGAWKEDRWWMSE